MMVKSFCGEFLLQSHAALHGEFLLVLHTLCWFMWRAPLERPCAGLYGEFLLHAQCWFIWGICLTCPVLVYMGSLSYMPSAGLYGEFLLRAQCWFMCGVSLTHPMLASFVGSFSHVYTGFFIKPREFFLYKTKRKM